MAAPETIRTRDLHDRLLQGETIQVVDVREHDELELARLPHPILHLPLSQSSLWMATLSEQLDRERPVAVICHSGIRSWHFACWLVEHQGFTMVWNVQGGIDAWSVEVDSTVPRY